MRTDVVLLTLVALLMVACQEDASTAAELWFEPGDRSTLVDQSSLRVGLRVEHRLEREHVDAIVDDLVLIKELTQELVPFKTHIKMSGDKVAYINVAPQERLSNEWYALRIKKSADWSPLDHRHLDEGASRSYRFNMNSQPLLREIEVCPRGADTEVALSFSERVQFDTELLTVSDLSGTSCEHIKGSSSSVDGSETVLAEDTPTFICRGLSSIDGVSIDGHDTVRSAAFSFRRVVGFSSYRIASDAMISHHECLYYYHLDPEYFE